MTSSRRTHALVPLAALLTLGTLATTQGCHSSDETAAPTATPSVSQAAPTASSAPGTSGQPTGATTNQRKLVRTGTVGNGRFDTVKLDIAPSDPGRRIRRYSIRIEQGLGIRPAETARLVQSILDDPRGWRGVNRQPFAGVRFQLVSDPNKADMVMTFSSPPTTDKLCLPFTTGGVWSCCKGNHVNINSDRWLHMTPTHVNLDDYRRYVINHEVGHYLGMGHLECPGKGQMAPVMMQQSIRVDACRPNPWPSQSKGR